ncbi:hypothetical protein JKP88DRAFT_260321 [Tribonema minus]|uniref:Uncharacterized protein n=1 Tax=Tribonema minus TaxID=303371 RepID=A0A836CJ23_9STRA|nr:hypothetical protein JKP88DRAFT_260321 [Tribonema minus]
MPSNAPWEPDSDNDKPDKRQGKRKDKAKAKKLGKGRRGSHVHVHPRDDSTDEDSSYDAHDDERRAQQRSTSGAAVRYQRARAGSCWCGRGAPACGGADGCCFDDAPDAAECPCRTRLRRAATAGGGRGVGAGAGGGAGGGEGGAARCDQCREDGLVRACCKGAYCKYCYEVTGNCPKCGLITTGANKGKYWAEVEAGEAEARDGEECRVCLRQGFRRKCCGEFFCSACYFRAGACPACAAPAQRRVRLTRTPRDPGVAPVLLGYAVSALVCLAALAVAAVVAANDRTLPRTVSGYRCYGFFPECSGEDACVEVEGGAARGMPDALVSWKQCTLQTVNKLYGQYCVHDKQVYVHSDKKWGYDMCEEGFPPGATRFQDTFDAWGNATDAATNAMLSGAWDHVTNGPTTKFEVRFVPPLQFWFKMGPPTDDPLAAACKPAYGGNVYIYFSTEGENFQDLLEHWALDDVRVVSAFAPQWHDGAAFRAQAAGDDATLAQIKCCMNSEQCSLSKAEQEAVDCAKFASESGNERAILGAERFVLIAAVAALIRWIYATAQAVVLRGWTQLLPEKLRPKQAKLFMADDPPPGIMDSQFALQVSQVWRITFMVANGAPLVLLWLWCASLLRNFYLVEEITVGAGLPHPWLLVFRVHVSGVFLIATLLDGLAVYTLAREVVCLLPLWVPLIDVDLRPSAGWLQIGDRQIKLKHIKDQQLFGARYCRLIAAAHVAGAWPWCLASLVLKYNYLSYEIQRYTTPVLGAIILIRAWLGPTWVLQAAFALRWLVTTNMYDRDEVGSAVTAVKTRYMALYSAAAATFTATVVAALVHPSFAGIAFGAALLAGTLYGLLLAVVQGLPVTPRFLLTTIQSGLYLRVHRQAYCPCDARFEHCSAMHSRDEVVSIFVRDVSTFRELLEGDDSIQP